MKTNLLSQVQPSLWVATTTLAISLGVASVSQAQLIAERPDFFEQGQEQFEQEIERAQRQRPTNLPILDVNIANPAWMAILLRDGGGTVWMPQGVLSNDSQRVESVDGTIDFEVISTYSTLGKFVVAFSGQVEAFGNSSPDALLDRVRRRIIGDQTGFGASEDRNISVQGAPGREFTLKNQQEVIRYRVILVSNRLYVLAVSQSEANQSKEAIATFFDAFQPL